MLSHSPIMQKLRSAVFSSENRRRPGRLPSMAQWVSTNSASRSGALSVALFEAGVYGERAGRFTVITRKGQLGFGWVGQTSAAHTAPSPNITPWLF